MFTSVNRWFTFGNMKTLPQKLKELRLARGMSLRQMSVELDKLGQTASHTAIARWEQSGDAANLPQRKMIFAIAELFNVSTGWLLQDLFEPGRGETNPTTTRHKLFSDIDLLGDTEFQALLSVKNELVRMRKELHLNRRARNEE